MHLSLLFLSLSLLLLSAAASPLPLTQFRFSKSRLNLRHSADEPPKEIIEVSRPLSFDSLTPSCTLPLLNHTFANTIDLPPTNTTYSAPLNCTWTNAVLQFSASANGSQYDRIAAVWLSGSELLRTSTAEPSNNEITWNFHKDVTKYSSLLRQSNLSLAIMLENVVNEIYTGSFTVNLTFLYYNVSTIAAGSANYAPRPNRKSTIRKLKNEILPMNMTNSLELNDNPADLILPISAGGEEGFWFKMQTESDAVFQGIRIPPNTYRAVIEVYLSFHGNDEFWYTNPPDYYIESNNLNTKRGHGAYREVLVKVDDNVVGSIVPFPVIFSGGINPLFWEPIASIGSFDLPSYEVELTPFLGILLDNKTHYFGFGINDAISFWLVDANLHLWLDNNTDQVQAGPIKYSNPNMCVERESKFYQLDGKFEVEGEKKFEYSGWVNSSAGNFTTYVTGKIEFENEIEFKSNGTVKAIEHEIKVKKKVEVKSSSGSVESSMELEWKYPLEIKLQTLPAAGDGNSLVETELEQKFELQKNIGNFKSKLQSKQECKGWMFILDHDVLSGGATTVQNYQEEDSNGCYVRKVTADSGEISSDTENFLCAKAAF